MVLSTRKHQPVPSMARKPNTQAQKPKILALRRRGLSYRSISQHKSINLSPRTVADICRENGLGGFVIKAKARSKNTYAEGKNRWQNIISMRAEGKTQQEIAKILDISDVSVYRILKKVKSGQTTPRPRVRGPGKQQKRRQELLSALAICGDSVSRAAQEINMSCTTAYRILKRWRAANN